MGAVIKVASVIAIRTTCGAVVGIASGIGKVASGISRAFCGAFWELLVELKAWVEIR